MKTASARRSTTPVPRVGASADGAVLVSANLFPRTGRPSPGAGSERRYPSGSKRGGLVSRQARVVGASQDHGRGVQLATATIGNFQVDVVGDAAGIFLLQGVGE